MSRVSVEREVLNWAIDRSDRTTDDLTSKFPKMQEWLEGSTLPTLRQIEALAKATLTPLGFFFLSKPPELNLPIPHYRTLRDENMGGPSPNLLETVQKMQMRKDWMREYLIEEGQEKISIVNTANQDDSINEIAQRMREFLNLEDGWANIRGSWRDAFSHLREKIESTGIMVVVNGVVENNAYRKLDPEEFRGFVLVDDYAPLVFVNGADSRAAQIFTLCHELAHIFYGKSAAFDLKELQASDNLIEQNCNKVAAEFLIPEKDLKTNWSNFVSQTEPYQEIARYFKVSVLVAARRALDLGLIDRDSFFEFYQSYLDDVRRLKTRSTSGGDFYNNQNFRVGRLFASMVNRATKEGKLLYTEAYKLTGLHGKTFDNYISKIELGAKSD